MDNETQKDLGFFSCTYTCPIQKRRCKISTKCQHVLGEKINHNSDANEDNYSWMFAKRQAILLWPLRLRLSSVRLERHRANFELANQQRIFTWMDLNVMQIKNQEQWHQPQGRSRNSNHKDGMDTLSSSLRIYKEIFAFLSDSRDINAVFSSNANNPMEPDFSFSKIIFVICLFRFIYFLYFTFYKKCFTLRSPGRGWPLFLWIYVSLLYLSTLTWIRIWRGRVPSTGNTLSGHVCALERKYYETLCCTHFEIVDT